jgi:hypothetical protein
LVTRYWSGIVADKEGILMTSQASSPQKVVQPPMPSFEAMTDPVIPGYGLDQNTRKPLKKQVYNAFI